MPRIMSLRAAATICGMSPSTFWRRIQEGHVRAIRLPGCTKLSILGTDLLKYIENSDEIKNGSVIEQAEKIAGSFPGLESS